MFTAKKLYFTASTPMCPPISYLLSRFLSITIHLVDNRNEPNMHTRAYQSEFEINIIKIYPNKVSLESTPIEAGSGAIKCFVLLNLR